MAIPRRYTSKRISWKSNSLKISIALQACEGGVIEYTSEVRDRTLWVFDITCGSKFFVMTYVPRLKRCTTGETLPRLYILCR